MEFIEIFDAVMEDVTFYVDRENKNNIYAEFLNGAGKTVFAPVESKAFEGFIYINSMLIDDEGKGIEPNRTIKFLKSSVAYGNIKPKKVNVHVRIAGDLKKGVEYDLQKSNQESVKVSKEGWEVSEKLSKFVVPSDSLPQVSPVKTKKNPLKMLRRYVNIAGGNFVLFVVWLIHCLCNCSHMALLLMAEAGSGKSTVTKIARSVIDPSDLGVVHFPDKKEDLCVLLSQSFFVCFDNMATISKDSSDVLCGDVTGSGIVKRALYTNSDLAVLRLHNTIMLNGVDIVPQESDLADRMLVIPMKRVEQKVRATDKDLSENFKKDLPEILGAIFNTLSKAMNEIDTVDMRNPPRMAGAYENMAAIARAMGVGEENFRNIFDNNIDALKKQRTVNPVVDAVVEYMNRPGAKRKESGYVKKIGANYSGSAKAIGGSASIFSRNLKKEISTLMSLGIMVNLDSTGSNGTRLDLIKN